MRWLPLLLLLACSTPQYQPQRLDRPEFDQAESKLLKEWELGFRSQDAKLAELRQPLLGKANTATWMTLAMIRYAQESIRRTEKARQGLQASLFKADDPWFARAVAELQSMGPVVVPNIVQELLLRRDAQLNRLGVQILVALGPMVLPGIADSLQQTSDPFVRRQIMRVAAGLVSHAQARQVLEMAQGDDDYAVRAEAYVGLSLAGDAYLPLLRRVVQEDPDPYVRRKVVEQLARFDDQQTAAAIVHFYADAYFNHDREGREAAERTLFKLSGLRHYNKPPRFWQDWVLNLKSNQGGF